MVDNVLPLNANANLIPEGYARLNITHGGNNGDLNDPIPVDMSDAEVLRIAEESIGNGSIAGIPAAPIRLTDYVVDRFAPNEGRPWALVQLRPKTPFGEGS